MVSTKEASAKAEAEHSKTARAQRELEAFGKVYNAGLLEPEIWWSQHYEWFKEHGYLLRPRYAPGWTPSWKGTKKSRFMCEDGAVSEVCILNTTRALHCLTK